jgi:hypothetical protein
MSAAHVAALALFGLLLIVNIAVTIKLALQSDLFTWRSKLFQALFIWAVPVVGACTSIYIQLEARDEQLDMASIKDGPYDT